MPSLTTARVEDEFAPRKAKLAPPDGAGSEIDEPDGERTHREPTNGERTNGERTKTDLERYLPGCDINGNFCRVSRVPTETEVAIIGNGPSAICLSYFLNGNWPFYNGQLHPNEILQWHLSGIESRGVRG